MGYFKNLLRSIAGIRGMNVLLQKGQWVWPDDNKNLYIEQGYREIPNLYAIISLVIQKSSMVPFEVYRVKSKTAQAKYNAKMMNLVTPKDVAESIKLKNDAMDKVEGSDLEMLLLKPNPRQSTQQFFEQLDGYERLTGNSYIWSWEPEVGKNAGKPIELHVPASTMVSIITGDISNPVEAYKLDYIENPIPVEQMGHFKTWNPITSYDEYWSGLYGMSPLLSCRKLMQKYRDADVAQGTMFRNMGPAGILSGEKDGNFTDEQALAIKDRFKQLYTGVKSGWEYVVTSAAVKWTQIGLSPVDLNILDGKEEMLGELCNIYHVPIGMFSKVNSTENNMVEGRKAFITDAVIPLVESRKGLLNRWLAPKFGDDLVIEFDYTIFTEVAQEVRELAETASKSWWLSPNERRAMTSWDKSTDPLMDKFYFPSGMTPLDQLNEIPEVIDETIIDEEEETVKKKFNPNQPRDRQGQWTDGASLGKNDVSISNKKLYRGDTRDKGEELNNEGNLDYVNEEGPKNTAELYFFTDNKQEAEMYAMTQGNSRLRENFGNPIITTVSASKQKLLNLGNSGAIMRESEQIRRINDSLFDGKMSTDDYIRLSGGTPEGMRPVFYEGNERRLRMFLDGGDDGSNLTGAIFSDSKAGPYFKQKLIEKGYEGYIFNDNSAGSSHYAFISPENVDIIKKEPLNKID